MPASITHRAAPDNRHSLGVAVSRHSLDQFNRQAMSGLHGFTSGLGILGILQTISTAILFSIFALKYRSKASVGIVKIWHVLRKGNKIATFSASDVVRSTWWGFAFAVFFYYALPLWWWQWGLRRALLLILLPIAAAVFLSRFLILPVFAHLDVPLDVFEGIMVTAGILVPCRVIAGFHVRKHHHLFRRIILENRGWHICGTVSAGSAAEATEQFTGPPRSRRFKSTVKRIFGKSRILTRIDA